jgi:hypothetical protein
MVTKIHKTKNTINKTTNKKRTTNLINGTKSNQTFTIKMCNKQKTTKTKQKKKPIHKKKIKGKPKIKNKITKGK